MKEQIFGLIPGGDSALMQSEFFNNTLADYLGAIIAFVLFLVVFKIFQSIILYKLNKFAEKTKTDIDDAFIKIIKSLKPPFYSFLAFYLALKFLIVQDLAEKIFGIMLIAWAIYQAIIAVQILIDYVLQKTLKDKEDAHSQSAIRLMGNITKAILWLIGILLFLSNLGINVTSLIAGLGVGGIAIALALQNVLGDLFSSFAIYIDRPFAVGDFITIGQDSGTVLKVGIKTTRIKTLRGEELVVSNQELTSTRVQNFKEMKDRRVVFPLGVTYNTSTEKVKKIPSMVQKIIETEKLARFDRGFFKEFADSALIFEFVYYVDSGEYLDYANVNQEIFFKIKEAFEKEKIEFAYPTQTVYLEK
ncbi:mechanosensitive ion channel family protein [Candidatus Falkowbacteria bacterium]|jgi:small-conductance mechanosensitive channel|nr:mechanosensitive ion channel family protein [Candidatus Falkowbacteria bacterium]MBT4433331.1 mechanosensitive ion channel family protein [Candidatus Falkowbacteria bacterium]